MSFDFSTAKDSVTNTLSYFCNVGGDYEKYRPLYPRSQGFTPQGGTALEKLILDLGRFCDRFSDNQGRVRLVYCTKLYLTTSVKN